MAKIVQVPVTKAKTTIDIDVEAIPQNIWDAIVAEGLKAFVNKGMSKIMTKGLEGDDLSKAQEAALKKGQENVAAILDGSMKIPGQKKVKGASGKVMTEARRLARNIIKDEIKRAGGKVSHYEASEITKAANDYLETEAGKALIAKAEETIKEREATPVAAGILSKIKVSDKLVKKAEAAKAARKSQLSAKQAGMTAKRAKGESATAH